MIFPSVRLGCIKYGIPTKQSTCRKPLILHVYKAHSNSNLSMNTGGSYTFLSIPSQRRPLQTKSVALAGPGYTGTISISN